MNLIVAVDKNWAIGHRGKLLVSIPEDMKFFRSVIYVNKEEIIKKKVLIKTISVIFLFVGNEQILNLTYCNFSHHECIVINSSCYENKTNLSLVFNFKQMVTLDYLTICRGGSKTF